METISELAFKSLYKAVNDILCVHLPISKARDVFQSQ